MKEETYSQILSAAVLLTDIWTTQSPSYCEQMNTLWGTLTVEHYSVRKSNKELVQTSVWINLEGTMLNEISQSQRLHMTQFHPYFSKRKP